MLFILSGFLIGAVMGLTGGGGALIAIPLFIEFFQMSLKEASVLSLVTVVIASSIHFVPQRHFVHMKLSIFMIIFSILGSLITTPYKKIIPDIYISGLLIILSLFALYSVWFSNKSQMACSSTERRTKISFLALAGLILGSLTTFTGLGGGILLVPFYVRFCRLPFKEAAATSILTIFFSALFSFLFQFPLGEWKGDLSNLILLSIGLVLSVILIGRLVQLVPERWMLILRKLTFSGVVLASILKILSL